MSYCSHSANLDATQKFAPRVTTARRYSHIVRIMRKRTDKQSGGRQIWYAREWITHKGLRQADIVARTPFNKGQVSEYVNGTRRWNEDVLKAFADAIGIDWADLLRPPVAIANELAEYVMKLDERQRSQVLKIIKAIIEDKSAA